MSNPDLYDLYDDEDAIAFIRKTLSPEQNKALDDDDLYNVIDLVYEYYEDHGYTNEDEDTEVLLDVDDICRYIKEIMAKDDMILWTMTSSKRLWKQNLTTKTASRTRIEPNRSLYLSGAAVQKV